VKVLAADVPRRRLLATEVLRMVEEGILREDEPVELIEGELVIVSPQGPLHSSRVMSLHELLSKEYAGVARLRVQMPIAAGTESLPEPDIAVVRGAPEDYRDRHPAGADVLLAVEVARTSQKLDREKALTYARAGVAAYWIVDLVTRRVEVRTAPGLGGQYADLRVLGAEETVDLPGLGRSVAVSVIVG
jgi:Uma2 family endonuclease